LRLGHCLPQTRMALARILRASPQAHLTLKMKLNFSYLGCSCCVAAVVAAVAAVALLALALSVPYGAVCA